MTAHPFLPQHAKVSSDYNRVRFLRAATAAGRVFRQISRGQVSLNLVQSFRVATPCSFDKTDAGVTVTCYGITTEPCRSDAAAVTAWAQIVDQMSRAPMQHFGGGLSCR
ncbi:hypothetical protein [uncultured Tateyamaria sp.]|uniref:hypothetical protein n=1 Tax=uncultured Tateyamaria sp. TaxID=455651 RepID=UPI002602341B|nr:hypothetical protein [uncultured Tateyamaria sp.]